MSDGFRCLKHWLTVSLLTVLFFYIGGLSFLLYLQNQGHSVSPSPWFLWDTYADLISLLKPEKWHSMTSDYRSNNSHNDVMIMFALGWMFPAIVGFGLVPLVSPWRTVSKSGPKTEHLRGLTRENNPKRFVSRVAKAIPKAAQGIHIHQNVPMPRSAEAEGILILGGTGSGKTKSIINRIFKEAQRRSEKIIVLDSKGDFTAHCGNTPGVELLAPWDTRSRCWDLSADISRLSDVEMIANAIVPPIAGDHQPIFRETAFVILTALMKSLWQDGKLTWAAMYQAINSREKLIEVLSAYESGAVALATVKGDADQADRFLSTLRTITAFLHPLSQAWPRKSAMPFSVRKWMSDGKAGVMILRYAPDFVDVSRRICTLASSIAIAELLSWPVTGRTPVWFLLDEVANLGVKIGNLAEGITAGRERGGKFVLATQDVTRMYDLYGQNEARSMLNSLRTFVAFSCSDKTNGEYAADCLGAEQEQVIETVSCGNSDKGASQSKSVTRQASLRTSKVVLAGELFELGKGQAFLRLPGLPVAKLQFDQVLLTTRYPHESLASWVDGRETRLRPVKPQQQSRVSAMRSVLPPSDSLEEDGKKPAGKSYESL
jgi:type IV secretory pathway TraG/TraD family ATPase VirD4